MLLYKGTFSPVAHCFKGQGRKCPCHAPSFWRPWGRGCI